MSISVQKVNIHNERPGQPTFAYVLPAGWCSALLWPVGSDALLLKVQAWLDELGLRRPFHASEVFMDKPENDLRSGWESQPCRTYLFSR